MYLKSNPGLLYLLLFILSLMSISCSNQHLIDKEFFVPVEKSNLYVRLAGNENGPLIINLHGGPGAFSGFAHESNKKFLEDDYLFAYLDQRGGGKSDVVTDSSMLTMDQFVEDLNLVVDTLMNRYKGKNINLIGSSWGGTLGLLYLINHQDKINAFACVSGKADGVYPVMDLILFEQKLADSLLKNTNDSASKEKYKEMLVKLKEIQGSDLDH